ETERHAARVAPARVRVAREADRLDGVRKLGLDLREVERERLDLGHVRREVAAEHAAESPRADLEAFDGLLRVPVVEPLATRGRGGRTIRGLQPGRLLRASLRNHLGTPRWCGPSGRRRSPRARRAAT